MSNLQGLERLAPTPKKRCAVPKKAIAQETHQNAAAKALKVVKAWPGWAAQYSVLAFTGFQVSNVGLTCASDAVAAAARSPHRRFVYLGVEEKPFNKLHSMAIPSSHHEAKQACNFTNINQNALSAHNSHHHCQPADIPALTF